MQPTDIWEKSSLGKEEKKNCKGSVLIIRETKSGRSRLSQAGKGQQLDHVGPWSHSMEFNVYSLSEQGFIVGFKQRCDLI